ncbi:MAG: acetyl-CoA carboxylase carboxyltransferase subunit alpha [Planctomycetes bacterium]|nr:acetyl-CoA carboxylase carboxyltransferase subunit alpha [Planctomycetota bacterium]MCC7173213.1 acetyl-CoA carboxylase carboxyltransferase subunit alpha [Planctomycetota bacterium]
MAAKKPDVPTTPSLDFEKPIVELENKIRELEQLAQQSQMDLTTEIRPLKELREKLLRQIYTHLTPWQMVRLARHPNRPLTSDYVQLMFDDVIELHGDRAFGDDRAILTALARIGDERVMLIAHRKGKTTEERMAANWGCAHPEGYRKALLKMKLAEKFGLPLVTLINTPGAYPGIGAEERGQAAAIAKNILEMSRLRVPVVSVVIGEGGSGGALGIGVCDRLLMLEYSYYSVISPEGCAAILWKDGDKAEQAATALKITSRDLMALGLVDEVVPEPLGGAHRDHFKTALSLRDRILAALKNLKSMPMDRLIEARYERYRWIGNGDELTQQVKRARLRGGRPEVVAKSEP